MRLPVAQLWNVHGLVTGIIYPRRRRYISQEYSCTCFFFLSFLYVCKVMLKVTGIAPAAFPVTGPSNVPLDGAATREMKRVVYELSRYPTWRVLRMLRMLRMFAGVGFS